MRPSERAPDQLRTVTLETGINRYAEGSCLVTFGHTKVLVTASVEESVPPFLRGRGQGWVTAEYGMLPRATHTRGRREAAQGKQSGRTQEIQRLIGRSMRAVIDMKAIPNRNMATRPTPHTGETPRRSTAPAMALMPTVTARLRRKRPSAMPTMTAPATAPAPLAPSNNP